ncbi:hypothetical protein FOYG_15634 [Fusarium oxysporum NRRL 32931]|uniref:Uncharacterized protein n=1 Tax=Fusarium oxysporum NRRL 32931 TaxID=660029 RepID=W9HFP3_FUSOX|nr:hypothetical protein FOYG_15634 [Fusarium oxysporum NRRL 32931]
MSQSNVGYPSSYEGGDQRHYSREEVREEGRTHPNVNPEGYLHKEGIMNELQEADTNRIIADRMKHEPGFAVSITRVLTTQVPHKHLTACPGHHARQ